MVGVSEGDYIVDISVYDPLAGYTIWTLDDATTVRVGQAGPQVTEWNTVLFAAEPTDISLAMTTNYNIPGIFDPVISDVVGPVTVTVQIEDSPNNLVAMDYAMMFILIGIHRLMQAIWNLPMMMVQLLMLTTMVVLLQFVSVSMERTRLMVLPILYGQVAGQMHLR